MTGVDRGGGAARTVSRYSRSGAVSSGSSDRGRSLEKDALIAAGVRSGLGVRQIARAMGLNPTAVCVRVSQIRSAGVLEG